jgi:CarboxypepD_reg-like domain/Dockerin type I domain
MSRSWVLLAGISLLLLTATPVLAASGDVNNDGRVDNQDVQMIDDYLNGDATLQDDQIRAADADNDGRIMANDKELLQRRLRSVAVKPAPRKSTRNGQGNAGSSQVDFNSANSGIVTDKATGQPLAGVKVSLPDEGVTVITDSQGRFQLPRSATGKILTAKASQYAPAAVANQQGNRFDLQLEKLTSRLQVIDDELHHLGDGKFGVGSANATDFRLRNQGYRYMRNFALTKLPQGDMILRIGSLIGLDTPQSVQAGQSNLQQYLGTRQDGLKIFLNGRLISQLYLNGDNITIPLPRSLLRVGSNQLAIETHYFKGFSTGGFPISGNGGISIGDGGLFDILRIFGDQSIYGRNSVQTTIDYDDIEFAHLVLEDPNGQAQGKFNSRGQVYQPNP